MNSIVFLVSGGGGSLRYIFRSLELCTNSIDIVAVIGDRESEAITFAREQKINSYVIKYKRDEPAELNSLLSSIQPDIVITNIHKILNISTLEASKSQFINLHYSLLPSFKGLIGMSTVDQARILNSRFIGVTSHMVTEELDCGLILNQAAFIPQWTSQKIELIYDTIFQAGCLVLLSSILSKLMVKPLLDLETNIMIINGNKVIFSDPLPVSGDTHSKIYRAINFE